MKKHEKAAALVILAILLLVSGMDKQDAVDQQSYYCMTVADGTHPDYKGTYDEFC